MSKRKVRVHKFPHRVGRLDDTCLDEEEKSRWFRSFLDTRKDLPIPNVDSTVRPKTLHSSWFSCSRIKPQENSNYSKDTLSNYSPEKKEVKHYLYRKQKEDTILRCKTYLLHADKDLRDDIKLAMEAAAYVYNKCVELARNLKKGEKLPILKVIRSMFVTSGGSSISPKIQKRFAKIHYVIKDAAIQDFLLAYKKQEQAVRDRRIKRFEMKYMKKKYRSISVVSVKLEKGETKYVLIPRFIGSKRTDDDRFLYCNEPLPTIRHTSRMLFRNGRLYIAIHTKRRPNKKPTGKVVALDPGVRTFQTTYDSQGVSYSIGEGDILELERLKKKACELREGWKTNRYAVKTKLDKPTKAMKRVARKIEEKIKNKVKNIHSNIVKFLCRNYDTVIIPPFTVSRMARKCDRRIGKITAGRLYLWSHYAFRQLLISKGEQTGTRIEIRNEICTTMVCSRCLFVNRGIGVAKVYDCPNCKLSISRDINGARNILIKNWSYL